MTVPVYCGAGRSTNPRMRDDHLSAQLFRAPYARRDLIYPNRTVPLANVDVLVDKIAATCQRPGRKIIFGHSAAARAICRYLRTEPDIDVDDNVFVLTGNQERKYGGASVVGLMPADYGGPGIPADCPFRVFDVARQYAFPEDCPTQRTTLAMANVWAELNPIKFRKAFHVDYSMVEINDPANLVHVEGPSDNIHYILSPSAVMPQCIKPWWGPEREALEDAKIRAEVESAFDRPYAGIPTARARWQAGGAGIDVATGQLVRKPPTPTWNPWA